LREITVAVFWSAKGCFQNDNAILAELYLVFCTEALEFVSGFRAICGRFGKVARVAHVRAGIVESKMGGEDIGGRAYEVDIIDNG
jgi:hypothetical protein